MRFRFFLLLLSVSCVVTHAAQAQDVPQQQKPVTPPKKASANTQASPTVITADSVEARQNKVLEATGNAELRQDDQMIRADHLLFLQESNELFADGSVRLEKPDATMTGPSLKANLDNDTAEMAQPEFFLLDANVRGSAASMRIAGKQNYIFEKAVYTSCPIGNDDWLLKMSELELDRNTQVGTAYNARVEFMGVPMLYAPWMTFPISNQRRSGLLAPTLGNTSKGGREITIPVYWNIAGNYDATFSPRFIQKRGTLYDNEFRYMGNSYSGKLDYGELQNDRLALRNRSHTSLLHVQNFGGGFGGSLNLNEASDDAYFRDLSSVSAIAVQKQLLREGAVSYAGGWWTASVRVQGFQTLQDPDALVALPYERAPQVNLGAQKVLGGAVTTLQAEYVDFVHPTSINGSRTVLHPAVMFPLVNDPGYYITPKLGVHFTQYSLGKNNPAANANYERSVPITSLDSGMTLEREYIASESEYVQTLEPRIYYVNIPYREQDMLPIFDTAPAAFTFVQMFTENRFIGSDRIGDADQVTAALTTRFLDADNGNELLRAAIGERFSMQTPRVGATTNKSDVLLSVGGRISNTLQMDSLAQYNPNESRTEMFVATTRYRPEAGKVFNLGYRYTFNSNPALILKQVDLSTQWPLSGRWHMVGSLKYSLQEARTVEGLAGLEYNQDCWALRLVAREFVTALRESSTSIMVQLELKELIRMFDDPLDALKMSVPGYTKLNDRPRAKPAQSAP